jgi:hypothetical protein
MYTTSIMLACRLSHSCHRVSRVGYVCRARLRDDLWRGMALAHGPCVIVRVGLRLIASFWKQVEESCYRTLVD